MKNANDLLKFLYENKDNDNRVSFGLIFDKFEKDDIALVDLAKRLRLSGYTYGTMEYIELSPEGLELCEKLFK